MTQTVAEAATAEERRDALVERLFGAVLGFSDVYLVYIGERLGLYGALSGNEGLTAPELADRTGTNARYVREWLEHQAVGGVLDIDNPTARPEDRRYSLPAGHDEVLLDADSPSFMAAFARMMVGIVRPIDSVLEAFRTGGGVPYAEYPPDFNEGQGAMNRVQFVNSLGREWLPVMADIDARLRSDPPALVADVACGTGWSAIALAEAYPKVQVNGIDLDPASIELAQTNAADSPAADRLTFAVRDAADPGLAGSYDLVTIFEAVHDMSAPVDALRAVGGMLADGGTVLVADERVADDFTAPGDDVERLMYGWSVLHCLPTSMARQPSAATGTAMRADTFRAYATEAGFRNVEILPIDNDFWRFYRLNP